MVWDVIWCCIPQFGHSRILMYQSGIPHIKCINAIICWVACESGATLPLSLDRMVTFWTVRDRKVLRMITHWVTNQNKTRQLTRAQSLMLSYTQSVYTFYWGVLTSICEWNVILAISPEADMILHDAHTDIRNISIISIWVISTIGTSVTWKKHDLYFWM